MTQLMISFIDIGFSNFVWGGGGGEALGGKTLALGGGRYWLWGGDIGFVWGGDIGFVWGEGETLALGGRHRGNYNSLPSDICRAKRTNVRSKLGVV